MNVWTILGTKATSDEREVKRAYARKLKVTRPEDDPQAFQELRDAYEVALRMAKHAATLDDDEPTEVDAPAFDYDDRPAYTPAFPQPAAAQDDDDTVIYTAAYEFDPNGAPNIVAPNTLAREIWSDFVQHSHHQPAQLLAVASASDLMLNLQVRECFELCAVQYCASEGCDDVLRAAIAEHFQWERDASFIHREMPEETGSMLARLRAQRSYEYFSAHARNDQDLRYLMAEKVPSHFSQTANQTFTRTMLGLVRLIRWQHPEMLHFKLNQEVFEAWESHLEAKRYFNQTAMLSGAVGAVLWGLSLYAMGGFETTLLQVLISFLVCQALSFGAIAWFVFHPPAFMQSARVQSWKDAVNALLHDHRLRPAWQFGWLPVYAFASLCLFIPNPSPMSLLAVGAMMLASACACTLANSTVISAKGYAVMAVIALIAGLALAEKALPAQDGFTCVLAVFCALQIFYRGGADLLDWRSMRDEWYMPARAAWLLCAGGLLAYTYTSQPGSASLAAMCWAWILAGTLLSRPSINPFYALMGANIGNGLLEMSVSGASTLSAQRMPFLAVLLLYVAIFMCINMTRAKTNQHQFT